MVRREHPCKQDCPNRSAECRLTCPDWEKYTAERDADYKKPRIVASYNNYVIERLMRIRDIIRKSRH